MDIWPEQEMRIDSCSKVTSPSPADPHKLLRCQPHPPALLVDAQSILSRTVIFRKNDSFLGNFPPESVILLFFL